MRTVLLHFLWLVAALLPANASSQELQVLRQEARAPQEKAARTSTSAASKSNKKRTRAWAAKFSGSADSCDDDPLDSEAESLLGSLFGSALCFAASTPFTVPRALAGDDSFDPGYHLRYPYLHQRDAAIVDRFYSIEGTRSLMLRVSAEHINDFESLSSTGGSFLLDSSRRWGLDGGFSHRRENLSPAPDELWTGDLNAVFRFAQSEQLQMRAGLGLNWLHDNSSTEFGLNSTYAGDWFPVKPMIVSHQIDYGRIGSATLFHGRITAGVNYHRLETYIGYDYYDVGNADIAGMIAGIRLWLSK